MKDLYSENYKTLMEEFEDDTNKWKDIPSPRIGRINIIKMSLIPKAIYRFNAIPIKISMPFFTELEQIMLKFVWNHKRPWIDKTILKRKNQAKGITLPDFKLRYKAIVIKNCMVLAYIDQWNRTESPDFNPCLNSQEIYNKEGKNIQ